MTEQLSDLEHQILKLCLRGNSIPRMHKLFFNNVSYSTVYRAVKRLCSLNYLYKIPTTDSPAIYETTPAGFDALVTAQHNDVNLIDVVQNSNSENDRENLLPKRCSPERYKAILVSLLDIDLKQSMRDEITDLFNAYVERIDETIILLRKIDSDPSNLDPATDLLILNYSTRFNDEDRKKAQIHRYYEIFEKIPSNIKKAVHVVLTLDPSKFDNLYEANKSASILFNRFMSYVQKTLQHRPLYLKVAEFQQNGRIHFHVLLFGVSRLLDYRILSKKLDRMGLGKITYLYALKREKNEWFYARERPERCNKGESANAYLKKYLVKGLYDSPTAALYWCFNVRFFTYSRKLLQNKPVLIKAQSMWVFWATCLEFDLPNFIFSFEGSKPPPI